MKPLLSFVFGAMLVLTMACARAPQTPTEIPPTPTTIVYPATWTPVVTPPPPPTRTPDPPTREVYKAFDRTRGLRVYHAVLDAYITDPTGNLATIFPGAKRGVPAHFMNMDGRQNVNESQWKLSGLFMVLVSGKADDTLQFISSGNTLYLNGPLASYGAAPGRWYYAARSAANDLSSNSPSGFLGDFSKAGIGMPIMHTDGAEKLDGRPCTIYRGDEKDAAAFFLSLDPNGNIKRNLYKIQGDPERGVFNVWVCDDGYVHKLEMGIQLRSPDKNPQSVVIQFTIRMNDMNVIVPIPLPQGAVPLPKPFLIPGYGNPSPQPTPTTQTS